MVRIFFYYFEKIQYSFFITILIKILYIKIFISKTEADNLEIGLFLRRLKSILESTEDQPDETLSVVVTLLSSYAKRHFKDSNENDIRNFMEDTNFVFKRNILCRSCDVSMMKFTFIVYTEHKKNGGIL